VPEYATKEELASKADLDEDGKLDPEQVPLAVVRGSNEPVATPGVAHVFNVKDGKFGAKGAGATNDAPAIQAAINAAAVVGGTVYLPAGTFKLTEALTVKSNVTLEGLGPLSVVAPAFAAGKAAVITNELVAGNSNISFRNFRLDRSGSNVQHGILLNGVSNLSIEGLEIVGSPSITSGAIGVSAILPGGSGAAYIQSKDIRIRGCHFADANNFGVQLGYVKNATVSGCTADECYREIIGVEPQEGSTAENVAITGNALTVGPYPGGGSHTGAIIVTGNSNGTVKGVSVIGNAISASTIEAAETLPGILANGSAVSGVVIEGNVIRNMNGAGIDVGILGAGVMSGSIVRGNAILNCNLGENLELSGVGISLRSASHSIVEGNFIEGPKHTASVMETTGAANNMIVNNFLRDTVPLTLLEGSGSVTFNNHTATETANITLGDKLSSGQEFALNTKVGTVAALMLQTEGKVRWRVRKSSGAEAGANAGSDFEIIAYDDAGTLIGTAFSIARSTRNARLYGAQLQIDGELKHAGTKSGVNGAAPVVKAPAIASPAAELAALKTAVDAIRTAIKNHGITE
jgi:hypothetical protein